MLYDCVISSIMFSISPYWADLVHSVRKSASSFIIGFFLLLSTFLFTEATSWIVEWKDLPPVRDFFLASLWRWRSWVSGHIGLLWLLSIVIVYLFQASFYTSCHIPKSWLQGWQNWREKEHFVSSPYLDLAATWLLFTSLRNSGTIMIRQFVWTRISGMGEATLHFSLNLLQEIFPRESFRLKSALFFQTNSVSQLKFRYFDREFSFFPAVIHLISWWNRNNNIFKKKQNLTITVMKKEFRSWQLWASSMSNSLELSSWGLYVVRILSVDTIYTHAHGY